MIWGCSKHIRVVQVTWQCNHVTCTLYKLLVACTMYILILIFSVRWPVYFAAHLVHNIDNNYCSVGLTTACTINIHIYQNIFINTRIDVNWTLCTMIYHRFARMYQIVLYTSEQEDNTTFKYEALPKCTMIIYTADICVHTARVCRELLLIDHNVYEL